MLAGNNTLKF